MCPWGGWLLLLMKVVGGAGWWPQRSSGPGKTPRVKDEEAERKGNRVSQVVWASLGPAPPDIWL